MYICVYVCVCVGGEDLYILIFILDALIEIVLKLTIQFFIYVVWDNITIVL